ncbi:CDI toxin immunity protein [Paenibacillus medicaginis]|uniref:CDI toxin immunity protein n=1 Tax=Paenibacillus medicaginis TaxID=1470560 RepID=UPI00405572E5
MASVEEAIEILDSELEESINQQVRLLWNYSDAPSVQVSLKQVVDHIDDVTAVGSDTWLIGPDFSFVIEIFHEGEIKLGFRRI